MPRRRVKGLRNIPKGSPNWYWYAYDPLRQPKQKSVTLRANDERSAELEAAALERDWKLGTYDPWHDHRTSWRSLEQIKRDYLCFYSSQTESTLKQKRSIVSLFLASTPTTDASSIRESDVEAFVLTSTDNERTRNKRLQVIRQFLRFCQRQGHADRNVAEDYTERRKASLSKHQRREANRSRQAFLMPSEARRLVEAARHDGSPRSRRQHNADVYEVKMCAGLRVSELVHLNWRDVSLDGVTGHLHVRAWEHGGTSFRTKTGEDRIIPLVPRAALALHRLSEARTNEDEWAPVFVKPRAYGASGNRLAQRTLDKHFAHYREALGLSHPDLVLHSLRHTFISWMVMLEAPPYKLMRWAGHRTLEVQSRYVHLTEAAMSGRAREVQRDLLRYLCPGISDEAVEATFPDSKSWYERGATRPVIPIEDALFGGVLYAQSETPAGHV